MNSLSLRKSNINALIFFILTSLSLFFPIIIHYLGLKGKDFLPIFFALSLGAYILNPLFLILLSIISPLLNYFLTKMPMPPTLYFLIFESIIFSIIVCLFRNRNISFILLVLLAFILARFSSFILILFFDMNIYDWLDGIINGYRGIIVNFLLASIMYLILKNNE